MSKINRFFFFSFTRIPQMMGTEGPKMFEFNTSTVLEKALKALPSHFKFEQTFVFLLFIFFWRRYRIRGIKILLDTSPAACTFIKKTVRHKNFPVNFCKIFKKSFFYGKLVKGRFWLFSIFFEFSG